MFSALVVAVMVAGCSAAAIAAVVAMSLHALSTSKSPCLHVCLPNSFSTRQCVLIHVAWPDFVSMSV